MAPYKSPPFGNGSPSTFMRVQKKNLKNCAYEKVVPESRLLVFEVAHFLAKPEIENTSEAGHNKH